MVARAFDFVKLRDRDAMTHQVEILLRGLALTEVNTIVLELSSFFDVFSILLLLLWYLRLRLLPEFSLKLIHQELKHSLMYFLIIKLFVSILS